MHCFKLISTALLLVFESALVQCQQLLFQPMISVYESKICAVDAPSAVFPIIQVPEIEIGIPYEVPDATRCGFHCSMFGGCRGFNYRQSPSSSLRADGLCELYTYVPVHCTTTNATCQYFKVDLSFHCCQLYRGLYSAPRSAIAIGQFSVASRLQYLKHAGPITYSNSISEGFCQ
jgi:hypothetical protein